MNCERSIVGIGILKRQKGVAILSLIIILPIFWAGATISSIAATLEDPSVIAFVASAAVPLILFTLTVWSLKYLNRVE